MVSAISISKQPGLGSSNCCSFYPFQHCTPTTVTKHVELDYETPHKELNDAPAA